MPLNPNREEIARFIEADVTAWQRLLLGLVAAVLITAFGGIAVLEPLQGAMFWRGLGVQIAAMLVLLVLYRHIDKQYGRSLALLILIETSA